MQLVDMANLTTGQSHQYCLKGTGGPLTVTLVWHDYPASLSAAKALVNDLDLTVRAAGLNGFPLLVRVAHCWRVSFTFRVLGLGLRARCWHKTPTAGACRPLLVRVAHCWWVGCVAEDAQKCEPICKFSSHVSLLILVSTSMEDGSAGGLRHTPK